MATIKEIIQSFCYRKNLPAPASFVGVAMPTQQQYLALFQQVGDMLRDGPHQWPQLKRGYYFNTQTNVVNYQLPGDFFRILDSCQWDVTNKWPMRGPISDYNYMVRQFAVVSLQTRKSFRIIGPNDYLYNLAPYNQRSAGWFEIDPAAADTSDQLFLGYLSCNWIWPRDWAPTTVYAKGDIRTGNGYVYIALNNGTSGIVRPSISTGTFVDGTVTWQVYIEPYLCTPSNTALNDDDRCLFDTELMISGLNWAYLQAKKLDYMAERQQWEQDVKNAFARFNGPVRINMTDEFGDYFDWPNIPQGSWSV